MNWLSPCLSTVMRKKEASTHEGIPNSKPELLLIEIIKLQLKSNSCDLQFKLTRKD